MGKVKHTYRTPKQIVDAVIAQLPDTPALVPLKCENCQWYSRGRCMYYPPTTIVLGEFIESRFPSVDVDDYCSHFSGVSQ